MVGRHVAFGPCGAFSFFIFFIFYFFAEASHHRNKQWNECVLGDAMEQALTSAAGLCSVATRRIGVHPRPLAIFDDGRDERICGDTATIMRQFGRSDTPAALAACTPLRRRMQSLGLAPRHRVACEPFVHRT